MKFEEKLIFPSGDISNFRIPSIIATKRGTVLAFCNDRKGTLDDHAEVASLCLVRKEAGKEWEELREICTLDGYHFLIGCAVYDENTDTAMIFAEILGASVNEFGKYTEEQLEEIRRKEREKASAAGIELGTILLKSTDDGVTWTEHHVEFKKAEYTHFDGRVLAAQGRTHGGSHGITLRHGEYAGRLLCPSRIMDIDRYTNMEELSRSVYNNAVYSDDHGITWHTTTPVQLGTGEGTLIEQADGTILYNSRAYFDDEKRYMATSTNGGKSYGDFRADEFLREPKFGCNASFLRIELDELSKEERELLPTAAEDVTVFVNPRSDTRKDMSACVSFDGGKTYSIVKRFTDQPCAYSSLDYSSATSEFYLIYEKGEFPDANNPYKLGITSVVFDLEWLLS